MKQRGMLHVPHTHTHTHTHKKTQNSLITKATCPCSIAAL